MFELYLLAFVLVLCSVGACHACFRWAPTDCFVLRGAPIESTWGARSRPGSAAKQADVNSIGLEGSTAPDWLVYG